MDLFDRFDVANPTIVFRLKVRAVGHASLFLSRWLVGGLLASPLSARGGVLWWYVRRGIFPSGGKKKRGKRLRPGDASV